MTCCPGKQAPCAHKGQVPTQCTSTDYNIRVEDEGVVCRYKHRLLTTTGYSIRVEAEGEVCRYEHLLLKLM